MAKKSIDPTRTLTLRKEFALQIRKRILQLKKSIWHVVAELDVFGIEKRESFQFQLVSNVIPRQFEFLTDAEKLKAFQKWLQEEIDKGLLEAVGGIDGQPWTAPYIASAYRKGRMRAFTDVRQKELDTAGEVFEGSRLEFLRQSFTAPVLTSELALLYTRSYEQLKGISGDISAQMGRILADAFAHGYDAAKTARNLVNGLGTPTISRHRANMIARTEIIHAHAEGQLTAFKQLGIKEVNLLVEWVTAGDSKVCLECAEMEGERFTIEEARGLIPLHPNCRCAWFAVTELSAYGRRAA